ncbi:MAG: IS256 family transposase [Gemmatimonadetes bacterium]|nr:IS256 family transposase [Gemmatimonadota bacterium]
MRKNGRKAPRGQRTQPVVSQLKLALGKLVRETLYETVLLSGLRYVAEVLETERAQVCGPRYRHAEGRSAYRSGHVGSSLVLGGRRVSVSRPRLRTTAGDEVVLPSWAVWSAEDPLEERAIEQMLVGVSTRKYGRSLEELPEVMVSRGTSRSAVSRRFVRGTAKKVTDLMERDLSGLDLKVLMLDGVHYVGEHVVVVAVGVDGEGKKQVLGLWEGATENQATCTALLESLVARGLRTDRTMLVVMDGSKALYRAVRAVSGKRALIQRCQQHKKRNVLDALPQNQRESVKRALNAAFQTEDPERAKRLLENLARSLEEQRPGAAAALREGLEELLTLKRLGLSGSRLERTLSSTNVIENLIGQVRQLSGRVKRWRSGRMILRWSAAGVLEAERGFRRLKGHREMAKLVAALQQHDATLDGAVPDGAVVAA